MFRRVALRVNREIGQDPWISASTLPEVYFAGKKPEGPTPEQQLEMAFWAAVKDNTDPAVLKTYLDRYPDGTFATAAQALIEQQDQRLKAEAAAREEQRKRAEEARKAADLRRKEEEKKAREARLAEERRRAEEMRNAAEASRLVQQQRQEALLHAEELRKAYKEVELAKEESKAAEERRLAAVKAARGSATDSEPRLGQPDQPQVRRPASSIHSDVQAGGLFSGAGRQAHARARRAAWAQRRRTFASKCRATMFPWATEQFIGVWVDEGRVGRRLMMIITRVTKEGSADGYWMFRSPVTDRGDAGSQPTLYKIAGRISDGSLRFSSPGGVHTL